MRIVPRCTPRHGRCTASDLNTLGSQARPDVGVLGDPREPTRFLPGSPEKVAILEARASLNISLWNPKDATFGKRSAVALAVASGTLVKKVTTKISLLGCMDGAGE